MILVINTCGVDAIVALMDGVTIIARESLAGREASEKLIPAMRRLLALPGPLEAVGVVHGPGSFTGVRVGLSAAKGLCDARGIGMIAISRLRLINNQIRAYRVLSVLDAGRGEFFCGIQERVTPYRECIMSREELLAFLPGFYVVTSEATVERSLAREVDLRLVNEPGAIEMAVAAHVRIDAGEWSDVATIDANYLRRTDAELLGERR